MCIRDSLNADKAQLYAKLFGADKSYTDYRQMLAENELDAVFIVTNYDSDGTPRFMRLAQECMKAGCLLYTSG